jgi:enamine deaminase RidA (YjgF/YER057c/UK114 family)
LPRSARKPPPRRLPAGARRRYSSGTPWEPQVGYSRAVRVGTHVYVSGTTATSSGGTIVGPGDPYAQTVQALDNIERALRALGSRRDELVRLRIYVTDLDRVADVLRALGERFRPVRPAMTLVGVRGLIDPAMLVEVEADAEDLPRTTRPPSDSRRERRTPRR